MTNLTKMLTKKLISKNLSPIKYCIVISRHTHVIITNTMNANSRSGFPVRE